MFVPVGDRQDRGQPLPVLVRIARAVEDGVLVALLSALIVLAATQIVLRNAFDFGLIWADELLRLMVLWLAMLGALAASRDDRQINIDVLSRLMPARARQASALAVYLFTCAVCVAAGISSARFVYDAWRFEDTVLGDVPAWPFMSVLPVAFGLIALRYLLHFVRRLRGPPA